MNDPLIELLRIIKAGNVTLCHGNGTLCSVREITTIFYEVEHKTISFGGVLRDGESDATFWFKHGNTKDNKRICSWKQAHDAITHLETLGILFSIKSHTPHVLIFERT